MKMRHIFCVVLLAFCFTTLAVGQKSMDTHARTQNVKAVKTETPQKPAVELTFDNELIELGDVKQGDKREFDFNFTNTGTETIEIEIVSGCECSTLDWTFKPILPGGKGYVNVIFDSTEKEESETVDIDLTLKNVDPKTGYQIFKIVNFSFNLIK